MSRARGRRGVASGRGSRAVVALLLVGLVAAMAVEPTRRLLEQKDRISTTVEELRGVRRANSALRAHIARLKDPDFIEQQARAQLGLVRPGEVAYVVTLPRGSQRSSRRRRHPARPPERRPGFARELLRFIGLT